MKIHFPDSFESLPFVPVATGLPAWKRAIDILFCLLTLPILCFWVLIMSAVTRLVSPGPVFFRQERVGQDGERFKIFKFRTMLVGADQTVHQNHFKELVQSNAPLVKLDTRRDARLIPGGWILRASGLDELPQLINVLRGEMSLVGPRPCTVSEFEHFEPAQRQRVRARPGLTGLWQVSGKNRTTFAEMIRLDIAYADSSSLLLDLKIILLTPWALLVQIHDTSRGRKNATLAPAEGNQSAASVPPTEAWRENFAA